MSCGATLGLRIIMGNGLNPELNLLFWGEGVEGAA